MVESLELNEGKYSNTGLHINFGKGVLVASDRKKREMSWEGA